MGRFCAATLWLACSTLSAYECTRNNIIATYSGAVGEQTNQTSQSAPINIGETLTLDFAGWELGGHISIKANTDVLLKISLEAGTGGQKKLVRSSVLGGQASFGETWGGWPLGGVSRSFQLKITLTESSWQFAIDGKRTPWFDFTFNSVQSGTGWEVSGLTATGSVADKVCSIKCIVAGMGSECQSCPSGICYSKSSVLNSNSCGAASDGDFCCDGTKKRLQTLSTISQGDTVSVVNIIPDDADYLTRACTASNILGTCADIMSLQSGAVSKMRVLQKEIGPDNRLTGRVQVWAPKFNTILLFSPWMLVDEAEVILPIPVEGGGDPDLMIELATSKVVNSGTRWGPGSGIPWESYLTRLGNSPFTMTRLEELIARGTDYTIWYSDTPQFGVDPDCITDWSWRDSDGSGCSAYGQANSPWCSLQGFVTDAFKWDKCNKGDCGFETFASAEPAGQTAADRCCACGGGNFVGWNVPAPPAAPPAPAPPTDGGEEGVDPDRDASSGGTENLLLYAGAGLAGLLVLGCCCFFAYGGRKSGADVGNRQLPPPDENIEQEARGGRASGRDHRDAPSSEEEHSDHDQGVPDRGDRDRGDPDRGDRDRGDRDRGSRDRGSRDRDYDDHEDSRDRDEDTRDYREEEDRNYRDGRSDGRAGRDKGRSSSNRQDRSMSRARSDVSMGDDPSSAGAERSLAAPQNTRGRRHQPKPKRRS